MSTDGSDEFIVDRDKVALVDSEKEKIERMYGTRIYFNEVSVVGNDQKRWLSVTGGKWDRQNAKQYILGLCAPEETRTVNCTADFLDAEILENIEKNTHAVIAKGKADEVVISGNELAVTLALSALEELTGCDTSTGQDIVADGVDTSSTTQEAGAAARDRSSSSSRRLDEKLEKALEQYSDGSGSIPTNCSGSIKRVLLECMSHEDEVNDYHLHGSGKVLASVSPKSSSEVILRKKVEPEKRGSYTVPIQRMPQSSVNERDVVVGGVTTVADGVSVSPRRPSAGVSTVTEKFTSAQISPVSSQKQEGRKRLGSDKDELRAFATSVGYTDEDVDEGFLYVSGPQKPSDFLEMLLTIKNGKRELAMSAKGNKGHADKSDDDIMIVDHHFGHPDEEKEAPLARSARPKGGVDAGGLSKSQLKKNKKKQRDLAREFEEQQTNGNQTGGTKRKQDLDSDQEQTCVMKVWQMNEPSQGNVPQVLPSRQQRIVQEPARSSIPGLMDTTPPVPHATADVNAAADAGQGHWQRPHYQQPWQPQEVLQPRPQEVMQPRPHPSDQQRNRAHEPRYQDLDANLRYVVIDGSNVAMAHGNNKIFSCRGIEIAVNFFKDRGHKVTVFIPEWRKYRNYYDNRIRDQDILEKLENSENLVFTPSRKIKGKLIASYDDRYILSLAEKEGGVILSNDQYRDLMQEKASWKTIIEERLLMYRFVGDHFMPAEDPLGRNGPMLDEFLQKNPPPRAVMPLQQRNTNFQGRVQTQYGQQPGQQQPIAAAFPIGHWQADGMGPAPGGHGQDRGYNRGRHHRQANGPEPEQKAKRHAQVTDDLLTELKLVFPETWQEEKVKNVLENHSSETDLNKLTNYCIEAIFK